MAQNNELICILNFDGLHYYLFIGNPHPSLKKALTLFEETGAYCCTGIITETTSRFKEDFEYPPDLVIVDLDDKLLDVYETISKLNDVLGIIPNYIGITTSAVSGFKAFKWGFEDVILAPFNADSILRVLLKYKSNFTKKPFFCVESYYDFQYVKLCDVVLLKADRYTTEFILKDGSIVNNYKNLKGTHQLLPTHFQRINRSCVINVLYVYRIHSGKHLLYLRHYNQPLRYTKKYKENIFQIKKILLNLSFPS